MRRHNSDNGEQLKVTYPKFKNGEATVGNLRISQNLVSEHWIDVGSNHGDLSINIAMRYIV